MFLCRNSLPDLFGRDIQFQSPAPAPYVKTMCESGQFYSNRVLKDWKEKSKTHVEWTRAWIGTLNNLQIFVKEHHTTGLVWKSGDQSKKLHAGEYKKTG